MTEVQACAALYPLVAEAARRSGASSVGLVGGSGVRVDEVRVEYSDGVVLGAGAPVTARIVGGHGIPPLAIPEVVARVEDVEAVPEGALPVVTTAWTLARLSLEDRLRFLHRLQDAAAHRPVAWASVEGVGVAPGVPTFGDRRASGHSILGLALLHGATLHVEALGRCWQRGRALAWLG